jgi:hypothetical protein
MQPSTLVTMTVIMLLVWGGFGVLLITALRKERGKPDLPAERERAG